MIEVNLDERRWFTTGQVGRMIHVSDNTIVRYIEKGEIKATRTPGGWYKIAREEAIAFLRKYKYDVELS